MSKVDINTVCLYDEPYVYFTENKNYIVKEIDATVAREVIKTFHYSKKIVKNSVLHLGVFSKETSKLVGALQYGYPMKADETPNVFVTGSTRFDMLELNRMAMFDNAPKLSESQALSLSIKYIKRFRPEVRWLLSFSDGKEGNVGIIYQATNWTYLGYTASQSFYILDGEIIHNVSIWHRHKTRKAEALVAIYNNVSKIVSKQHRYVYPLYPGITFNFGVEPYPKRENEPRIIQEIIYKKNGAVLPKKKIIYKGANDE